MVLGDDRARAARLAFALAFITLGVNLQSPLFASYGKMDGVGVAGTTLAFSFYVLGVLPVLLALGGLSDRIGRRPVVIMALALSALGTSSMLASPHVVTLALARFALGVGTALMSATATAYMTDLMRSAKPSEAANWVTASTSIGFGLGPALTSVCLMVRDSMTPISFTFHLVGTALAALLVWRLPNRPSERVFVSPMIRLPHFTPDVRWYGGAILLCWATSGLVISILPSALAQHGLSRYAGLSTMLAISCGLLFQPMARKLDPVLATKIGLLVLVPSYALLAWGACSGTLVAVLTGSFFASSSCYGFVYLGGLAGTVHAAGNEKARATAGYFLMAYFGFSVPVVFTGLLADRYGSPVALIAFGMLLLGGTTYLLTGRRRFFPTSALDLAGSEACGEN